VLASVPTVVVSSVSVKNWIARLPSTDAVRPKVCPWCDAPSRPVGESLVLVGHGTRSRQCLGPLELTGPAEMHILRIRRFLCRACERTCTVVPREVCPGRLYLVTTIAWALAWWALADEPAPAAHIRQRLSPWKQPPHRAARRGWPQLARWAQLSGAADLAPHAAAGRIASLLVGHSPSSSRGDPPTRRAYLGAIRHAG
jgi:hypothetical protein